MHCPALPANITMLEQKETIAAVATAKGEAGIGIIRLSGESAISLAAKIFQPKNGGHSLHHVPERRAIYGYVIIDGDILDDAMAIVMPGPHSYTGEDVVEIQGHGSPALLKTILRALYRLGARPAEPGEYTRRAFLNGRLDLIKAQAVMDIIQAKTAASLKMAAGHLTGRASKKIESWRKKLLDLIVHLEATIDFPEEGIEEVALNDASRCLKIIGNEMKHLLATRDMGRILRDGLITAIIGKPNVGKSSLLNALLGEDRAIVTNIAGTTRDSIEEYAEVGGVPLRIIDTAGIRDTFDTVERFGVERSRQALEKAELVLVLFDGSQPLDEDDQAIIRLCQKSKEMDKPLLALFTKNDLPFVFESAPIIAFFGKENTISISVKTNDGLNDLENKIVRLSYHRPKDTTSITEGADLPDFYATQWESHHLEKALSSLSAASEAINSGLGADCATIDLKDALASINAVLGLNADDDIIGEIFSRFCVGK